MSLCDITILMMSHRDIISTIGGMPRWEPDTRERLRETGLALFVEHGYENVSAEMIAERAGVTRRTFFRHFPDKRDVLFAGSEQLPVVVGEAIASAPEGSPAEVLTTAILAVAGQVEAVLRPSPDRRAVIAGSAELRERENTKHEAVVAAITDGLRGRGVDMPAAVLLGRVGGTVFRTAFENWTDDTRHASLVTHVRTVVGQLQDLWAQGTL